MTYQEALRKALACLRLAERGGTTAESALAAAMAQQIITKYSLDISDVDFDQKQSLEDNENVKDFGYTDPLDVPEFKEFAKEMLQLARTVASHNQCCIGFRGQHNFVSGKERLTSIAYRIVGRPSDVATVRYLYGFYKLQVINLVADNTKGNSYAFKRQFAAGVIDAITEKLNAMEKETFAQAQQEHSPNPLALARVNSAIARIKRRRNEAKEFFLNTKRVVYGHGGTLFKDSRAGHDGKQAGLATGRSNIRTSRARTALGSGAKQIH